jgi:hypothetical protein
LTTDGSSRDPPNPEDLARRQTRGSSLSHHSRPASTSKLCAAILEAAIAKLLTPVGLVVLAMVATGCSRSTEPTPSATSSARAASSTVAPAPTTSDPAVANWPTFTSEPGGYRLNYPPGWKVREDTGSGGPVLSLLPPKGLGISVLVTSTAPPEAGAAALPNTRCQPVRVGGLEGTRCLDTVTMVVSTALKGRERWYVLTASLRRPSGPARAYDRVVGSFRAG